MDLYIPIPQTDLLPNFSSKIHFLVIQRCPDISRQIHTDPNMSKYVQLCQNMFKYVQICSKIFQNVSKFQLFRIFQNVQYFEDPDEDNDHWVWLHSHPDAASDACDDCGIHGNITTMREAVVTDMIELESEDYPINNYYYEMFTFSDSY